MTTVSRLAVVLILGALVQLPSRLLAQEGQTIEVHAKRFSFEPAEITLEEEGDR